MSDLLGPVLREAVHDREGEGLLKVVQGRAAAWATASMDDMKKCLNIGCGDKALRSTVEEEWINLDIRPLPGVDVVRDIRFGLPFSDATMDHLLCDNNIEHFTSSEAIRLINEMDRILKPGGTVRIIVPDARSQGAWQDPTHVSAWVPRSFLYWSQIGTPYGGLAIGITANLVAIEGPTVYGDMATEAFINVLLRKEPLA